MKDKEFPPILGFLSFGAIVVTDIFGTPWTTIVGIIGITFSLFCWRYERNRGQEAGSPPVQLDSASEAPAPAPPEPQAERAYVDLTPYELWQLVSGKTDAVAPLEAGRYIGALLPAPRAKLINVEQEQDGQMVVLVEVSGPMVITLRCYFDAQRWRSAFLLYDPGQSIALEGRIVALRNPLLAFQPHIILEDCKLVEARTQE